VANPEASLRRLLSPIRYLKGVGPKRAAQLESCDPPIRTLEHLLLKQPLGYIALRPRSVREIRALLQGKRSLSEPVVFEGTVVSRTEIRLRGKIPALSILAQDDTGMMELVYPLSRRDPRLLQSLLNGTFKLGQTVRVLGRASWSQGYRTVRMVGFTLMRDFWDRLHVPMVGRYGQCGKLRPLDFNRLIHRAWQEVQSDVVEILPAATLQRHGLMTREEALRSLHFPRSPQEAQQAVRRLAFEELFLYFLELMLANRRYLDQPAPAFGPPGELTRAFLDALPFQLTPSQEQVLQELEQDLQSRLPMHRLLQGDVGSGKTVISLYALLRAVESGYQGVVMAPTEVLAEQLFLVYQDMTRNLPVNVALLEGSMTPRQKSIIREGLQKGEIHIVVGTHAVIQEDVHIPRLGLAVVDEQHRFGVVQRARLLGRGPDGTTPHFLLMTATPIPRTLALTLYGDLDVSYLRHKPPGRGPLITKWIRSPQKREELYRRIFQRIQEEGDQCYVVAPAIETPEKLDLRAVEELYEELQKLAPEEVRIALLHGRMSAAERRTIMEAFRQGEIHMLVTTTVVEVGVDVPNANLMVIEDADRFGLSQLHQLRGRIHRSIKEAYCFLITRGQVGRDARKRMQVMVESTDGFELAQKDLELRGSGELTGVRQHGRIRFQYVRLEDPSDETRALIQTIRDEVRKLVQEDPDLNRPEHRTLRLYLQLRRELQQVIPVG